MHIVKKIVILIGITLFAGIGNVGYEGYSRINQLEKTATQAYLKLLEFQAITDTHRRVIVNLVGNVNKTNKDINKLLKRIKKLEKLIKGAETDGSN